MRRTTSLGRQRSEPRDRHQAGGPTTGPRAGAAPTSSAAPAVPAAAAVPAATAVPAARAGPRGRGTTGGAGQTAQPHGPAGGRRGRQAAGRDPGAAVQPVGVPTGLLPGLRVRGHHLAGGGPGRAGAAAVRVPLRRHPGLRHHGPARHPLPGLGQAGPARPAGRHDRHRRLRHAADRPDVRRALGRPHPQHRPPRPQRPQHPVVLGLCLAVHRQWRRHGRGLRHAALAGGQARHRLRHRRLPWPGRPPVLLPRGPAALLRPDAADRGRRDGRPLGLRGRPRVAHRPLAATGGPPPAPGPGPSRP